MQDQPNQRPPRATHAGGYTVAHAIKVFERIATGPQVPELTQMTGSTAPTVRRTAHRLKVENYLVQDGGRFKRYRPTMRLAALGLEVVRRAPLPRLAQPVLERLRQDTGGRAHLWIAGPGEPIDLARPVMGDEPLIAPSTSVLDPRRDHLRSVAVIRHEGQWTIVAAVMDHQRVAAAVGLSGCDDLALTRDVLDAAARLEQDLARATTA